MLKPILHRIGRAYVGHLTNTDAERQVFKATNERPVEYAFVFAWLNRLQPRAVLDVGTGTTALPALVRTCGFTVTAIDNVRDYWPKGVINRHWRVLDEDITAPRDITAHDVVLCVSVLEHIADPLAAIRGMHRLTRPGGHVLLTTPFGAIGHPNVYSVPGSYGGSNPYICRQSAPEDLDRWKSVGFSLVHADYWRAFVDSDYWSVGARLRPIERTDTPAHLGCFVLQRD